MDVVLIWLSVIFSAVAIVLLIVLLKKSSTRGTERIEQAVRDEFRSSRDESAKGARDLREEVAAAQKSSTDTVIKTIGEIGKLQKDKLESVENHIKELTDSNEARIEKLRGTLDTQLKSLQESNEKKLDQM